MSKFENAFETFGGNAPVDPDKPKIDFKARDEAMVNLFDTKDKAKSRVGIISGIVDLGVQAVEPASVEWKGTPEDEAVEIEKNPNTYFEDVMNYKTKKMERRKRWPQKAQRAIAITVDFPQYQYDFGEPIGTKPLRFLLNGEFIPKGKKYFDVVLNRTYDLKETTKDFAPLWSLATNSLPYKLAVATDVIKAGEPFTKNQLGKLIGKPALFEVRLHLEGGYMQERISFKGEVPEGMAIPEVDESTLYYINLDAENDPAAVQQLRLAVKNTIKRSVSYEGSKLQQQYHDVLFPVYNKAATPAQQTDDSSVPDANDDFDVDAPDDDILPDDLPPF